jgi:hypothetical protein
MKTKLNIRLITTTRKLVLLATAIAAVISGCANAKIRNQSPADQAFKQSVAEAAASAYAGAEYLNPTVEEQQEYDQEWDEFYNFYHRLDEKSQEEFDYMKSEIERINDTALVILEKIEKGELKLGSLSQAKKFIDEARKRWALFAKKYPRAKAVVMLLHLFINEKQLLYEYELYSLVSTKVKETLTQVKQNLTQCMETKAIPLKSDFDQLKEAKDAIIKARARLPQPDHEYMDYLLAEVDKLIQDLTRFKAEVEK